MASSIAFRRLFPPPLHQRFMTNHTEDSLRCPGIFEILNLLLAIPAFETGCAKGLIPREDCKILDLVPTCAAAIRTIVANE